MRGREGNLAIKEPQATVQDGGKEKGIGRPAETEEDRTKNKTPKPRSEHFHLDCHIQINHESAERSSVSVCT